MMYFQYTAEGRKVRRLPLYFDLMNSLTPEMHVWSSYFVGASGAVEQKVPLHRKIVEMLNAAPAEKRNSAALAIVRALKQPDAPDDAASE
jgi:hypothetical protein